MNEPHKTRTTLRLQRGRKRRHQTFWWLLVALVFMLTPWLMDGGKGGLWHDDTRFFAPRLGLGAFRDAVATEVATLSTDHGTWGLAFSPHGRYLAASSPQTAFVQLWDWRKDRVVRRFRRSGSDIMVTTPLAFSPHGRLLASCQDVSIDVWNPHTGAIVGQIQDPPSQGGCQALAFSPRGHSLIWIRGEGGLAPKDAFFVYSEVVPTQRTS